MQQSTNVTTDYLHATLSMPPNIPRAQANSASYYQLDVKCYQYPLPS